MAKKLKKTIITCAITGGIHTPTMSDALPYKPEDIAQQALDAAAAGAAIVHLHARDPEDGRPRSDPELFRQILEPIKAGSDVVMNITTGGGLGMSLDERLAAATTFEPDELPQPGLHELRPSPASGPLPGVEVRLGAGVPAQVCCNIFANTFSTSVHLREARQGLGVRFELECYDVGPCWPRSRGR